MLFHASIQAMKKTNRIFIAINLPQDVKKALSRRMEQWKDLPAKWTPAENLHITLSFLGDLTDIELAEACVAAKAVIAEYEPFSLNLNKITYGPKALPIPKFVWVKGEKIPEIAELKNELEGRLAERIPFKPEHRGFAPHITLARISSMEFRSLDLEERPEVNLPIELMFTVASIEIMKSEARKEGQQYTVVESFPLLKDEE